MVLPYQGSRAFEQCRPLVCVEGGGAGMATTNGQGGVWHIVVGRMGGRSKVVGAALMTNLLLDLSVRATDDLGHEISSAGLEETSIGTHSSHEIQVLGFSGWEPEIQAPFAVAQRLD